MVKYWLNITYTGTNIFYLSNVQLVVNTAITKDILRYNPVIDKFTMKSFIISQENTGL